ncbi:hypothetical protein P153DRAFT_386183 [Dothidotthia symphoricarpi CBS 119687]|uniref:Uncharacterized protein n=1 Tax=Dothidotthia symphoricarpi CBS 119687 TaxID=1392245 RepID=A0A6A6ADH6_9PLEO|nr:uncharacterized protein P153DRAFT_386183 [Dothidotthia symphoricarpi CBS 119687]KAF2128988.1 hypothetical protein P153DRAFT_386183 [Dothidotthia symphoricarpi CBS 119687]
MSVATVSTNPLGNCDSQPNNHSDTFCNAHDNYTTAGDELSNKSLPFPDLVEVPTLQPPPRKSPRSASTDSPTLVPSSPPSPTSLPNTPIQWTTADLIYLTSLLHPTALLTNTLLFSPPLDSHPTHLRLYTTIPRPPSAIAKLLPTSITRPHFRRVLFAESEKCPSAASARASLAHALLADEWHAAYMLATYDVLAILYSTPLLLLTSIHRGMLYMLAVSDAEWHARLIHLRGGVIGPGGAVDWSGGAEAGVDGSCGVEARLELFLLESGRTEIEGWVGKVGVAVGLSGGERVACGVVYGDAAAFLGRVVGGCG